MSESQEYLMVCVFLLSLFGFLLFFAQWLVFHKDLDINSLYPKFIQWRESANYKRKGTLPPNLINKWLERGDRVKEGYQKPLLGSDVMNAFNNIWRYMYEDQKED